jgi:hypothetical protein
MQTPPINGKLSLEWVILPDGRPALAFSTKTWAVYEQMAQERGKTAQEMIAVSVAGSLGPILVDNYAENRRR